MVKYFLLPDGTVVEIIATPKEIRVIIAGNELAKEISQKDYQKRLKKIKASQKDL